MFSSLGDSQPQHNQSRQPATAPPSFPKAPDPPVHIPIIKNANSLVSSSALATTDSYISTALLLAMLKPLLRVASLTQGDGNYGQNLAAFGTTANMNSIDLSTVVADAITNRWYYGEAAKMPYGQDHQDSPAIAGVPEYLHFSQVLWKSTALVGCATVQCEAGTIFPFCNYVERGNVIGSFASQVTKLIGLAGISANIS
ncbi:hypothetical protein IFR05_016990 [Cadophora sp. M221]|nr:hypothetical protein IFR05_016990 [Cadophora sp. M221]